MGYYIQTPGRFDKDIQLGVMYGAVTIDTPTNLSDLPDDKAVICVLDNVSFEAAGLAYNDEELEEFKRTRRLKACLLMDKRRAHELSGYRSPKVK